MKTETTKKKSVTWHLIILAIIGAYGLYQATIALIALDWGLWAFWQIIGGVPFTIVCVTLTKRYVRFRR